ncbi:MAG TPA: N-acetylmuramoyl-L-alanine amidase [Pseudomonadales bacterium]
MKYPCVKPTILISVILTLLFNLPSEAGAAGRSLKSVRMHESPEYTRVVFDISGGVRYDLFTLDNPRRVVIDLADTAPAPGFDPGAVDHGHERVKSVRGSRRGQDYRVVLDLGAVLEPKSFTLEPVAPYGHRLVVDLYATVTRQKPTFVPKPEGKRDVIIAVDAGHGGEDPGAIGPRGIREKDVVMKIARRLESKLNHAEGYRAVMVRSGDYYLAHRLRTEAAREAQAHLFVSIHADAFKSPDAAGASVYTLSDRGASSETARWLAASENASDLIGGVEQEVVSGDQEDYLLKAILEVSMDANRSASIEVGERVLTRLGGVAKLHKKRVEQAGFMVLKSPDVPSILVETGFISNPSEAARLGSADYQERIADAIFEGIRAYMSGRAPEGTLVAWRREQGGQRYTIARGDTLSGIAVRYGTSARRIKELNGLANDRIRVGQVITIPAG